MVRNLFDGRVEAIAVGSVAALKELEKHLLRGPPRAEVTALEVKQIARTPSYEGFLIAEDGGTPWFEV